MSELLTASAVSVDYGRRSAKVRAVNNVDLVVRPGEILGLVGESGCGKSTLGRAMVGLEPLAGGSVRFRGLPVASVGIRRRSPQLRPLQMVFQDPYASLNPRRRVGDLIGEAVVLGGGSRSDGRRRAAELLERVGLPVDAVEKYPHEFSGGQRQRIAIARTLAADPNCVIADEPISALDASAQAAIATLLTDLVADTGMGMLFISHDLSVIRQIANRVAVMYLGQIVETGHTQAVWDHPTHPYTEALVAAVPRADGAGTLPVDLPGDVPDPASPPSGCRFHPRCSLAEDRCIRTEPVLVGLPGSDEPGSDGPGSDEPGSDEATGRQAACLVRAPGKGDSQ